MHLRPALLLGVCFLFSSAQAQEMKDGSFPIISNLKAGVAKVVASIADPNPLVAGQGFARLRAAGVDVQVGPGAKEARELNIGFFSRMIRKIPWVRLKAAASLDGTGEDINAVITQLGTALKSPDAAIARDDADAGLNGIGER